jgi:hypothetical protein
MRSIVHVLIDFLIGDNEVSQTSSSECIPILFMLDKAEHAAVILSQGISETGSVQYPSLGCNDLFVDIVPSVLSIKCLCLQKKGLGICGNKCIIN